MKYNDDISKVLSRNITNRRNELKYTQEKLAEEAKLSAITVWKIENREQWPSPDTLQSIANALKMTPAQLFYDEGNEKVIPEETIAERDKHILSFLQSEFSKFLKKEDYEKYSGIDYDIKHKK